jgi:uncharacterized protein YndB with AHSA1/START domain
MLESHAANELRIHFEIEINAPPEKVWAKLATLEGMNEWFSRSLVFEPRKGGRFQMEVKMPDSSEFTFFGEVTKIEPNKELTFTWIQHEKGQTPWPVSTTVSFKLWPSDNGTTVTLTHSGFEALDSAIAQNEYEGHIVGWQQSNVLADLKTAVENAS